MFAVRHQVGRQAARAAQDDLDARQQFARVEGLGQVVVGAEFEADDAVDLVAARGEHQDRQRAVLPPRLAQIETVAIGEHGVKNQQVERAAPEQGLAVAERAGHRHRQAARAEVLGDHAGQCRIVIDHQYTFAHGGSFRLSLLPLRCSIPAAARRPGP